MRAHVFTDFCAAAQGCLAAACLLFSLLSLAVGTACCAGDSAAYYNLQLHRVHTCSRTFALPPIHSRAPWKPLCSLAASCCRWLSCLLCPRLLLRIFDHFAQRQYYLWSREAMVQGGKCKQARAHMHMHICIPASCHWRSALKPASPAVFDML